ncbi:hypothetical protein [Anaerosalibacter massiliensis]|uniref:Uncharacterized protein n=1 Tax=Anaerosalibacter massiliensis TaxID=1347392 RepID=A0A9X2MH71_9FIRM|nr:hypothetical protein [Anaerosalibacter massiliensis]MCR2043955.1 hypothetical protein [Anaerosalibacter massiliensis]
MKNNKPNKVLIIILLISILISTKSIIRNKKIEKWIDLLEGLHEVDKIEVIGYEGNNMIFEDKEDVGDIVRNFYPLWNVDINKKKIDKYVDKSEPSFKIKFHKNGSLIMTEEILKLSKNIEKENSAEDLRNLTFKIKGDYYIVKINNKYCSVQMKDDNVLELFERY